MSASVAGDVTTNVYESGALYVNGMTLPPTSIVSASCIEGWRSGSITTSNENFTSSLVSGWPSENRAPRRR